MGIGGGLGLKAFLTSEGRNNDISYRKRKKKLGYYITISTLDFYWRIIKKKHKRV